MSPAIHVDPNRHEVVEPALARCRILQVGRRAARELANLTGRDAQCGDLVRDARRRGR